MKFLNKAEIEKAILSIQSRGKKLDQSIQEAALSIIKHVHEHGEVSLANKLFKAMPAGARKNALVEWFLMYSRVGVNQDKVTAKEFPLVLNKEGKTDLEGAVKTPWFECRKEKAPDEVFDFNAAFARLLNQVQRAGDNITGDAETIALIKGMIRAKEAA